MNKLFKTYLQICLILMDFSVLNLSFFLPRWIMQERISPAGNTAYLSFLLFANGSWLLLSMISGSYLEKVILQFEAFTKRTVQTYILWIIIVLLYLFFSREMVVSRYFIISFLISFAISILINRFLYVGIRNYFKTKEYLISRVIILGYNETAEKLSAYFEEESFNTTLVGYVEDEHKMQELTRYPVLGGVSQVIQIAKDHDIQEIYSTLTPEQNTQIYQLMSMAEREFIRFKVVPNLSYFFNKPVIVDYLRDLPILSPRSEPLEDMGNRIKKRILDIVISTFVILFFLSWMIPLIGLIILLESRGPIFFVQHRSGKNNRPFRCLKFRSMRTNKEADNKQATKNDHRVTRIGRFLRKTSLDEFPQFINVFLGEMSLVGPRPHMLKHTDDYSQLVDHYMIRHFLKPGITGWAQINGYRGEITEPKQIQMRVRSDLWYLENWSIWLDIRILFLTIYTVIRGDKNAY
jgi:putative colanic acid biosynthesis UDP-glucose lipid carrier transferase